MRDPHPIDKWIRARKDGRVVVDSRRVVCVWRDRPFPFYAFPAEDVDGIEADPVPEVPGHVSVRWSDADEWLADEERLHGHARDPFARIDVVRSSRHVVVEHAGERLAESRRPLLLYETGLRVRTYLPPEDVRLDLLTESPTVTRCPYKGTARYWSRGGRDLAWSYPNPIPECPRIKGLIAFFDERVDVVIDGERQPRPQTDWA